MIRTANQVRGRASIKVLAAEVQRKKGKLQTSGGELINELEAH